MADNKKSFVLYCDLIHTIEKLPDDKAGLLLKHLLRYVNDQNPVTDDLIVDITFEPIKHQLKRDLVKYEGKKEQWSEAGKASAEARKLKKINESERTLTDVKNVATVSTVTVTDSVNVTDTVNDNDIYLKRENLTEFVLDDLENSTHLELVCKRTSLTLDQVKSKINDFKQIASVEYPKPIDLINHFIRWLKINKDNGNINKKHYYLSSPHGNWDGLLTEDEFKAKTLTNYWTLIKTV